PELRRPGGDGLSGRIGDGLSPRHLALRSAEPDRPAADDVQAAARPARPAAPALGHARPRRPTHREDPRPRSPLVWARGPPRDRQPHPPLARADGKPAVRLRTLAHPDRKRAPVAPAIHPPRCDKTRRWHSAAEAASDLRFRL